MEHLEDFLRWMEALPPLVAYTTLLLIAYGENVIPPIPGDMAVVFGGYLAGLGQLSLVAVVALATVGGVLGFMTMYAIGHRIGDAVLDPEKHRWIPKDQAVRAKRWLDHYGYWLVAANRFLSGLRSVISLTVGMAHTDAWKTAGYATLSALLWTTLITYAGYAVGDNWPLIASYLRDYGRIVLALLLIAAAVQFLRWYLKRKGSRSDRDDRGNFNSPKG